MIEKERGPGLLNPDRRGKMFRHGVAASIYADMCEKMSSTLGAFCRVDFVFGSSESCSRPRRTASICDKIWAASEAVATRRISFFFRSCALKLHRRSLISTANRFNSWSWFTLRRGEQVDEIKDIGHQRSMES